MDGQAGGAVEVADVVVIGSGFGGSVVACRAAQHGLRVVVLERGRRYRPGDFPRTPHAMSTNLWDPSEGLFGLFQLWSFSRTDAIVSSGVGGGSLLYANVTLPMPRAWFDAQRDRWPLEYGEIAEHHRTVEKMLGVTPVPEHLDPRIPKVDAFARAARRAGMVAERAPLAVTFSRPDQDVGDPFGDPRDNLHGVQRRSCRLCGECDLGCNEGAKNTLDLTYLSQAASPALSHPADIRPLHDVKRITAVDPEADQGYDVDYVVHTPPDPPWDRSPRPSDARPTLHRIRARTLVVAAGALGSTRLLLANRAGLPHLGPALGTRFSGNGDALGFLTGGGPDRIVESAAGPVITGFARHSGADHLIEDGGQPAFAAWVAEAFQPALYARAARTLAGRWWERRTGRLDSAVGKNVAATLGSARVSRDTLPLLAMGVDRATGVLRLGAGGRLDLEWPAARSARYFAGVRDTMAEMAAASNLRFRPGPWAVLSRSITAHPLGGVPMGRDWVHGVVDSCGQAWHHPGLFVVDGSVLPGPAGANPSMTIAALAERFADAIVQRGMA